MGGITAAWYHTHNVRETLVTGLGFVIGAVVFVAGVWLISQIVVGWQP